MPTLAQLITVSDSAEPIPHWVTEDEKYLYGVLNYGGNPNGIGRVVKFDLTQSPPTLSVLASANGLAMWQGLVIRGKNLYIAAGEFRDSSGTERAGLAVTDITNDNTQLVYHPNTGDCNEFIGIAFDYKTKQLIVGERKGGGGTTGSSWPNGGGLWIIPIEDVTNTNAWNRVYEFSPLGSDTINPEVFRVTVIGDQVFVSLVGTSQTRIAKASINDLTAWTVVEDIANLWTGVAMWGRRIAYISTDANTGNAILKYSDDAGATWNSVDLGSAPNTLSDLSPPVILPMLYGKYAIVVAQNSQGAKVLLVDVDGGTVTDVGTMANPYTPHMLGTQRNDKVFIGNNASDAPSYIYQLTFDVRYVLALSLSKSNPALGETITLTATLKDSAGNPVANAEIEFYLVTSKTDDRHYGELIGTAQTDANGVASIQYTVPSTLKPGDVLVFRAVYKG